MKITLGQKLKLLPIFIVIRILWVIDDIGEVVKRSLVNIFRLSLYTLVVVSALTSFYVEARDSGITNVPNVLNPESPEVLGAVVWDFPRLVNEIDFPKLSAVSVYAVDLGTDKVLFDKNSDFELPPASTSKIMTALVAMDLYALEETIPVPKFCTEVEGLKAGFYADDLYTVKDLLFSMLVNSSADAACTLALGKIPYSEFIGLMNAKANDLGLLNSSYTNPVGLDGENGSHYSSAKDLVTLGKHAQKNDLISEIILTKETTVTSLSGFSTYIVNTNDLLWTQPGSVGIKTGRTDAAGEVLIYEYDLNGKNIIISLMHSNDRFGDTLLVLNWILNSYIWEN